MTDLNRVSLIGRLTSDADLKYTKSGCAVSMFSIAVNRSVKKGDTWIEETSFFEVSLFGKSAENLKKYLVKGKQVSVDGELKQERWETDGQKKSKVIIIANNVQLLGGNGNATNANNATSTLATQQTYQNTQAPVALIDYEDDIPF